MCRSRQRVTYMVHVQLLKKRRDFLLRGKHPDILEKVPYQHLAQTEMQAGWQHLHDGLKLLQRDTAVPVAV
jgi:hypothetical protein